MFKKVISLALSVVFSLQTCGFAQAGQLNLAGYLGQGSGVPALDRFRPAHLRYFSYEPDSDNFQILLDKADEKDLSDVQVKDKADELMRYFRIGLSLPNDKFWVNLRPDAPEQIIDPALEQTDMGKIMLDADLQLKKDTSSLTSPQTKEGKEYWDKLYKKAGELFGTENITIPTITRPWIVPGEIIVRQSGSSAYIYKAALKVMLEEDYLNNQKTEKLKNQKTDYNFPDPRMKELNKYSTQLIRELIIPQLTKEVNRAKRYAGLRQVYYSLILARWFKQSYQNSGASEHQSIRAPVNENNALIKLIDSGNLSNLTSQEPWSKDTYYQGYKKSFEQGEYNLSETVRTPTGQLIRRYVSGGISAGSALTVDDHFDIGKVNNGIPGVGDKGILFNYTSSGSKPVVRAAASPLVPNTEIPERLKGWPIFESIEKLALNQTEVSFETNILIGKTVCTTIQVLMAWAEVDEDSERIIKYWIVEFKENAKSKEPVARIKVYSNDSFSAETPKNLSDTERDLIVAQMLSKPLFLDKSQMEELEKKGVSSALTRVTSKGDWFIDKILKTAKNVKENLTPEEGKKLEGILYNMERLDFLDHVYAFLNSINSNSKTIPVPMNLLFTALIELGFFDKIAEKNSELMKSDLIGDADNVTYKLDGEGIGLLNYKLQYVNISVKSEGRDKKFLLKFYRFYPGVQLAVDPYADAELEFEFFVSSENGKMYKGKLDGWGEEFGKAFMALPYKELRGLPHKFMEALELGASSALTLEEAKDRALGFKDNFLGVLKENGGYKLWKNHELSRLFVSLIKEIELSSFVEGLEGFIKVLEGGKGEFKKPYDDQKKNFQESSQLVSEWNNRWDNVSRAYDEMLAGFKKMQNELSSGARSALNSENKESKRLIIAIEYVAKKLSELTPISGIIFYASGGMTGLGTPALYYNDDHFRSEFKKINKSISEYKKPAFWSIELKQGSTFEQIKNRLLEEAGITVSSAIVTKGAAPEDIGAVDFRVMDMLIQPAGSFSGLDFSPVRLSSSALEAMDLDKGLENIKQMASSSMLPSPQRLKEYISACIFKGKIDEKADDFILSMLEVFQFQAEEGIESASQDREAVVMADTRGYVLPEKEMAMGSGYSLN